MRSPPDRVNEIAKRTNRYFQRTMQHVVRYKEAIDGLIERAAENGYRTINLEGRSDVDFLGEHESRGDLAPDTGGAVHLWNVLLEADEGRSSGG